MPCGDRLVFRALLHAISMLEQKATGHVLGGELVTLEILRHQEYHVWFRREDLAGFRVEARGDEDFREDLGDLTGKLPIDGTVQRHDAAESRGWVGGESFPVSFGKVFADRRPTRVGVLHDDRGRLTRLGEIGEYRTRSVDVVEVVERERASLQLLHAGEQVRSSGLGVVGRLLVRVLAISQDELAIVTLLEDLRELFGTIRDAAGPFSGNLLTEPLGEPAGDGGVVLGGLTKGF